MIHVGTSGFGYRDWVGPVYPRGIRSRDMLPFYAERFSALELNSTFYGMPTATRMAALQARAGGRLRFVIKAHRSITHERTAGEIAAREFLAALEPFQSADSLGGVLLQFPFSFHNSASSRRYLYMLSRIFTGIAVTVELRNSDWLTDALFPWLTQLGFSFCCVDQPALPGLLPRQSHITVSPGYLRFHGRNGELWWEHEHPWQRYDYLYREGELREWLPALQSMIAEVDEVFVFFNNHYGGQAVANAELLIQLLAEIPEIKRA